MQERLLDIEVSDEYGTVTEEIELICTMTGFRRKFFVHHIGEGFFRSVELEPTEGSRYTTRVHKHSLWAKPRGAPRSFAARARLQAISKLLRTLI
jgi:hypothetical protein